MTHLNWTRNIFNMYKSRSNMDQLSHMTQTRLILLIYSTVKTQSSYSVEEDWKKESKGAKKLVSSDFIATNEHRFIGVLYIYVKIKVIQTWSKVHLLIIWAFYQYHFCFILTGSCYEDLNIPFKSKSSMNVWACSRPWKKTTSFIFK